MAYDFTAEVMEALNSYAVGVNEAMQKVLPNVAKEAAKQLQNNSPHRTGKYASGWRQKTTSGALDVQAVVYNAKAPGLSHLLEHGHLLRNGKRSRAVTHIKPVEEWVISEAARQLEGALSK